MTWLVGIDISYHQTSTPSLGGLDFVFARATYGTRWDTHYQQHAGNVRAAGIVLGAYHFGRSVRDPVAQADAFLVSMTRVPTHLVALDVELDVHPDRPPDAPMTQEQARIFIDRLHAKGYRCGLYHSESRFFDAGQDFDWIANWTRAPARSWDFWQYRGSPLDLDRCRWTEAELRAAERGLPDTSTGGYMGAIVITEQPYEGTFTIPAGVAVTFLRLDLTAGTVAERIAQAARTSPSSAPYDAEADLSGIGIRGNPFLRVADGPFAGLFITRAGLAVLEGSAPAPDCSGEVAAATAPLEGRIAELIASRDESERARQRLNDERRAAVTTLGGTPGPNV